MKTDASWCRSKLGGTRITILSSPAAVCAASLSPRPAVVVGKVHHDGCPPTIATRTKARAVWTSARAALDKLKPQSIGRYRHCQPVARGCGCAIADACATWYVERIER